MMPPKYGLVLAGGGGKGSYQVGVWQALEECGIADRIEVMAGTSVGGLNAALFLQGGLNYARAAWESISPEQVLSTHKIGRVGREMLDKLPASMRLWFTAPPTGFFSHDGLIDLIDRHIDLKKVSESACATYVTACCVRPFNGQPTYFRLNESPAERVKEMLLASSAIPVAFDLVDIDGRKYCDGGALDQVPVKPVYDAGCDVIFVVHLDKTAVNDALYPHATIVHIVPSKDIGDIMDGVFDFNVENVHWRMNLGRSDALRRLVNLNHMASGVTAAMEPVDMTLDRRPAPPPTFRDVIASRLRRAKPSLRRVGTGEQDQEL